MKQINRINTPYSNIRYTAIFCASRQKMQSMLVLISVLIMLHVDIGTVFCQNGATSVSPGLNYRVLGTASNTSNYLQLLPDGTYRGFIWDLLNTLKDMIGFNFTLTLQADGKYGVKDSYGNWDGMIGQLISNNVDIIAVGDFAVVAARESVMDYTIPHLCAHVIRVTQPNASLDYIKYATAKGNGSSTAQFLQGSPDPVVQAIWANIQANDPMSRVTRAEGLALVRQGGWAFVAEDAGVALDVDSSYGQLVITGAPLNSVYYALGVQLGSNLRKTLSIGMEKMRESGQMQQLLVKWGLGRFV